MGDSSSLVSLFWYGLIFIAVILLIREISCWYWKLNKIVVLLEQILEEVKNEEDTEIEEENI